MSNPLSASIAARKAREQVLNDLAKQGSAEGYSAEVQHAVRQRNAYRQNAGGTPDAAGLVKVNGAFQKAGSR